MPARTDGRSCKHNIGGDVEKWSRRHGLGERIARHTDGILTRGCLQYTRRGDISVLRWLLFRNIVFFILEFEPPTMTRGVRILDDGEFIDCQVPPVADFPNAVCHHTCGMTKKSKKRNGGKTMVCTLYLQQPTTNTNTNSDHGIRRTKLPPRAPPTWPQGAEFPGGDIVFHLEG